MKSQASATQVTVQDPTNGTDLEQQKRDKGYSTEISMNRQTAIDMGAVVKRFQGLLKTLGRNALGGLTAILVVAFCSLPGFAQVQTEVINGKEAVAHEVLVKFRIAPAQNAANLADIERSQDIDTTEPLGGTGTHRLRSRSKNVSELVANLSRRLDVMYAEPNYIVHADSVPDDPLFVDLWGLQNAGQIIGGVAGKQGADVGAVSAWGVSTGSRANVIAVVDTGIDYNHADLAANVWSAPAAFSVNIGGQTINCPAGSHGFNAIINTCDPIDHNKHGSHVSGTIGAVGNNNLGVVGVNWTASIMGVKFLAVNGSGTTTNAINGIEFAIQAKRAFGGATGGANVRILSNSWGGAGFSQSLLDEINSANSSDMLFVAAAGNSGSDNDSSPFFPASYNAPNVVAVAATDNNDNRASFSNFGASSVHLGAPGVNILSTTIGGNFQFFSGTSMATPHVSGAAALLLSKCNLQTASLKGFILTNVDQIPSLSGVTVTGGRLNVNKAIRACTASSTYVGAAGDYDGDGQSDIAVSRPSEGNWYILLSSRNYDRNNPMTVQWGTAGDIPVPGDYFFAGITNIAVWRPSEGTHLGRGRAPKAIPDRADVHWQCPRNSNRSVHDPLARRSVRHVQTVTANW